MPLTDLAFWLARWKSTQAKRRSYDVDTTWTGKQYRAELEALVGALSRIIPDAGPGETVLDYGCGVGRFAPMLQEKGWRYVGADLFPELLAEARRQQPDAHFVLAADAVNEKADLLFLSLVLQHFSDGDAVMLLRRLPGREIVVVDDTNRDSSYVRKRTAGELEALLARAGFDDPVCIEFCAPRGRYKILRAARAVKE